VKLIIKQRNKKKKKNPAKKYLWLDVCEGKSVINLIAVDFALFTMII